MTVELNAHSQEMNQWLAAYEANAANAPDPQGSTTSATGSATGATANADATNQPALLTPDALMAYCETRLSNLDAQMQTIFQQQQTSNKFITDVDNAVDLFNQYSNGINSGGSSTTVSATDFGNLTTTLMNLEKEAPPGSSAAAAFQSAITTLNQGPNGSGTDTKVSATDITNIVTGLTGVVNDANSSSQLNMITLQSLMSEQQAAVQMTTNLVQTLGQQQNAIASNVGK
jgi:hypothetical protein